MVQLLLSMVQLCTHHLYLPMVIAQRPNVALSIAAVAALIQYATTGTIHTVATAVYYSAISSWSYMEIAQGASWFRRVLGGGVMGWTLYTLFIALS